MVLTALLIALPYPVAAVIPLTVLLATFEAIRPLHFGAERIGRYLQVFYEEAKRARRRGPCRRRPGSARPWRSARPSPARPDTRCSRPSSPSRPWSTCSPVVLPEPLPEELALLSLPHLAFLAWLVRTDGAMRAQRPTELARFRELRDQRVTPPPA